ncbi:uncharacterized protein isoform X2 [Musca autumnalis]
MPSASIAAYNRINEQHHNIPQSVVVLPTQNNGCLSLMPSPNVERFIMDDLTERRTSPDVHNEAFVVVEQQTVRSIIQIPNNPLQRITNGSDDNLSTNRTTTERKVRNRITATTMEKGIRKPPYMYTKPKHEVLGGFVNFTIRHLPPNVNAILGLGDMFALTNTPKFVDFMRGVDSDVEPSMYYGEYLKQNYEQILQTLYEQNSPNAGRLIQALKDTVRVINNDNYRFVESLRNKCTVMMESYECRRNMEYWLEKAVQNNVCMEIEDAKFLRRWKRHCHKKFQLLQRDLLHNREMAKSMRRPPPYADDIQKLIDDCCNDKRNCRVPCLYGQLKIDDEDRKLVPIVNTIGWYSYPLEKLICHVLKKVVEPFQRKYYVRDITRAAADIRNTPIKDDYSFVKIEFDDIYGNTMQCDILLLLERLVQTEIFKIATSIEPRLFMQLLKYRFEYLQLFEYSGKTYKQLKGLQQGSGDSLLLIQLLFSYVLSQYEYEICRFPTHSRVYMYENELLFYVCDTEINSFRLNLKNYIKQRFKVTTELKYYDYSTTGELKMCGRLNFLDIGIQRNGTRFLTKLHDPTLQEYDGETYYSIRHIPIRWKNSVLQGHLRRIIERTSNAYLLDDLYHLELEIRDYYFPQTLRYIIEHYLQIYDRVMSQGRYEHNPICNFESMTERIWIMRKCLYDTNNKYPNNIANNPRKRPREDAAEDNVEDQGSSKRARVSDFLN